MTQIFTGDDARLRGQEPARGLGQADAAERQRDTAADLHASDIDQLQ